MGTVNDIAGVIGGTILCLELIVLLLLLVAINGGLAFGLWWVARKMGFVREKRIWAMGLVQKWSDRAMRLAAEPVIRGTSVWRGLKAGLYRATHWPARETPRLPASTDTTTPRREGTGQAA